MQTYAVINNDVLADCGVRREYSQMIPPVPVTGGMALKFPAHLRVMLVGVPQVFQVAFGQFAFRHPLAVRVALGGERAAEERAWTGIELNFRWVGLKWLVRGDFCVGLNHAVKTPA